MKYKKYNYILLLILMLLVGINKAYATEQSKTCYYMSNDENFKARLVIKWRSNTTGGSNKKIGSFLSDYANVTIDKLGADNYPYDSEGIINWWEKANFWPRKECISDKSVCFEFRYKTQSEADVQLTPPNCPNYLVMEDNGQIAVWATDDTSKAENAQTISRKNGNIAYYGRSVTANQYFKEFIAEGIIELDPVTQKPTCKDYETIFGNPNTPGTIRYTLNEVLGYIRVIVPILIILLGTIDFAKAVLAGKEDTMKKAQSDFVKRLIAGILVFFVPTIVNIVMWLADIVWVGDYTHCGF